jgi:hypothetical protein
MAKSLVWTIGELVSKFESAKIIRPKIQRRQCWDETGEHGRTNNADFMKFIRKSRNIVTPFVLVLADDGERYVLVDGNNRLNAIIKNRQAGDEDIELPICLFPQLGEAELIDIYEKINITGIKLSANDILAAKASCYQYGDKDLPDFATLYAEHLGAIREAQTAEVLTIPIGSSLTQHEVLAAKQRILEKKYSWMEGGYLFDYVRHTGYNLERPINLGELLCKIDSQAAKLALLVNDFGELPAGQMKVAFIEGCRKKYAHYQIYTLLRQRVAGGPSPVRAVAKSMCAYTAVRTAKQIEQAIRLPPPSAEALRSIISSAVAEIYSPCKSPAKRRAIPKVASILLTNFHKRMMPPIHAKEQSHIEHIIPHSTEWSSETKIDISRLGNLTILPASANLSRGNSAITVEYLEKFALHYAAYPSIDEYHKIVEGRRLISADNYNELCQKREAKYIDDFVSFIIE